jgi:hypothetical protein
VTARALAASLSLATALLLGATPASAVEGQRLDGVLIGVRQDVVLPADREADVVMVVQGRALVEGVSRLVVVIDGEAVLTGPRAVVQDVVAVTGSVRLGPGARVGRLGYLATDVTIDPGAHLAEPGRNLALYLGWLPGTMGLLLVAAWLGAGLAILVAGVLATGLAASQARRAGRLMTRAPLEVVIAGLAALVVPPVVAGIAMTTVVGIPLGLGILAAWGLAAVAGYIVAGIRLGEALVPGQSRAARPYVAALVGLALLVAAGIVPPVTLVAVWLGLGAVTLAGWRVLTGRADPRLRPPGSTG